MLAIKLLENSPKICRKSQRRVSWTNETTHWVRDRESFKWLVQVFLTGLHLFERHVLFPTRILSHKMLSFKQVTSLANWEGCILFRLRCACILRHVLWQVVQVLKLLITAYFAKNDSEGDQKTGQQLHLPSLFSAVSQLAGGSKPGSWKQRPTLEENPRSTEKIWLSEYFLLEGH